MNSTDHKIKFPFQGFELFSALPSAGSRVLILFPLILFAIFAFGLALPATRAATMWVLDENHPVEVLTFIALVVGGAFGLRLTYRMYRKGEPIGYVLFYFLFSIGLLVTGLEEIAWGQQFWGFATPDSLKNLNMQGETTIHNLKGFHGNTEVFRLLFGLGGLAGILVTKFSRFARIGTPIVLFSWFALISAHSAIDVFDDIFSVPKYMEAATSQLAEFVELLIGLAGCIYLVKNSAAFEAEQENA